MMLQIRVRRLEPDIEPGAILEEVTAPGSKLRSTHRSPTANCGDVAVPVRTPAN